MYKILLTCVGGNFTYDTVKALRINNDFKSFILGVDVNKNVEKWFLDKFEVVQEQIYLPKIMLEN